MKERAVTYSVVPRVDPRDISAEMTYYARAQARGEVTLGDMARRIQRRCTVTRADTLAVLVALEEEVCRGLCNGEIVRLGELGSLQVGVKSEGVRLEADFHESMMGAFPSGHGAERDAGRGGFRTGIAAQGSRTCRKGDAV